VQDRIKKGRKVVTTIDFLNPDIVNNTEALKETLKALYKRLWHKILKAQLIVGIKVLKSCSLSCQMLGI
jgi:bisphosphoglycerate-independent phosphoglycerate mutase (AlkP superfamily)